MADNVHTTSDTDFEKDVLQATGLILVDFWAEWCGPCRMIAPILDEVATEYEGRLKVVKVNVDKNRETPAKYNVRGIPTLLLFKEGNVIDSKVGALIKSQLTAFIDEHL
ncbi:MAG: thioredoxin [Gammaproteobacteria bacterium RIFCSPHIGHO2_12_FULL_41_15]|nr:MAG: thioredoxin [Gammaproteobacteria bacterium RIFCSPHIGHO2_12_FULL_41_15]